MMWKVFNGRKPSQYVGSVSARSEVEALAAAKARFSGSAPILFNAEHLRRRELESAKI
jgi:hypothetical protein